MIIRKALIVYKRSAFEMYFKKKSVAHFFKSHQKHYSSLEKVENILKKGGIAFKHLARGKAFDEKAFDLVISLGGDGTFLDAARYMHSKLILGVNSDKSHSVGRFCAADHEDFEQALDRLRRNRFEVVLARRIALTLNGKSYPYPVLNDILMTHVCPAGMSHYHLDLGKKSERQRSSGLWVSTAAGSTGAVKSAGGKVFPIDSGYFQYRPRELYPAHGMRYVLTGGVFKQKLEIISKMQDGRIFIDGAHQFLIFRYGDRLVVRVSKKPLKIIKFFHR